MAGNKTLNEMLAALEESETRKTLKNLFDEGSFVEVQQFISGSGECAPVVTGYGQIEGAVVYAFAQDTAVKSGAMDKNAALKIKNIYKLAVKNGAPIVAFYNSNGGDINQGGDLLAAYSEVIADCAMLSGVVPQISIVGGVCAGVNATLCCMADFVLMTKDSEFFLTAPFIAEDGKLEGTGTAANAAKSAAANIICDTLDGAVKSARKLISILPQNNLELSGNDYYIENTSEITAELNGLDLITAVSDKDSVIEINKDFGSGAVTALGSVSWRTIGFVSAKGRLTGNDAAKIARFVNICDSFSIPVVTFIDTEGFEASCQAELAGCIRDTAKLAQVYNSATTQKVSVIIGNAIGASAIAIGAFSSGSDICLAYENAVISPATVKAAAVFLGENEEDYRENRASVYNATQKGLVDRVIQPGELREAITSSILITDTKRVYTPSRKHINLVF